MKKIGKLDFVKLKSFWSMKYTVEGVEREALDGRSSLQTTRLVIQHIPGALKAQR